MLEKGIPPGEKELLRDPLLWLISYNSIPPRPSKNKTKYLINIRKVYMQKQQNIKYISKADLEYVIKLVEQELDCIIKILDSRNKNEEEE